MDAAALSTLLDEATKKSGLVWVRPAGPKQRAHGVWHLWQDGAAFVLTGGLEQQLPALEDHAFVTVRSKDKGSRLLTWIARVDVVEPDSDVWDAVVPGLMGKRLNLPDGEQAPQRWARECVLYRLTPTGEVAESPDEPSTLSHAAVPPSSPARTRTPRPLHLFGRPARRRGSG
jgi:hypothetical protein